jgi:hypothetical protein
MATIKKKSILDQALEQLNKTDAQLQRETLTDRLEDFRQSCTEDISNFKVAVIPRIQMDITKAEREVAKAKKEKEVSYLAFTKINSFACYTEHLFKMALDLDRMEEGLARYKSDLTTAQEQQAAAEELLTILSA